MAGVILDASLRRACFGQYGSMDAVGFEPTIGLAPRDKRRGP